MLEVGLANYAPTLRWKKGEYEALASLDDGLRDRLLPHIILPPISARDGDANRKLRSEEFAPIQIGRIAAHWGHRPCLLDCRFIKFAPSIVTDAQRFGNFLTAAAKFGCGLIPVFDLQMNDHRLNALKEHWLNTKQGLALRLSLSDLGRRELDSIIHGKLRTLVAKPSDCFLLVDFSDADLSNHDAFAHFAHDWLFRLQQAGMWRRSIIQSTSYPERNPAQPNRSIKTKRAEWLIWKLLFDLDARVREIAMFGDFGADNAQIKFDGGGAPITHLRYATKQDWLIARGGAPTSEGDGTIRQVAKVIVASGEFDGADFSAGDELIANWATGRISSNGASEWRKANMSHHWTRVLVDIGVLNGLPIRPQPRRQIPIQGDLFAFPPHQGSDAKTEFQKR